MSKEREYSKQNRLSWKVSRGRFENSLLRRYEKINFMFESQNRARQAVKEKAIIIPSPSEVRGIQSVQSIFRALDSVLSVTRLIPTERNGQLDSEGIDLIAEVEGMDESIGIQVKSSQKKIYEFKKSLAKRVGVPRSEINNWCSENRLIILNGSKPEKLIIARFQEQLAFIKSKRSNLQFFSSLKQSSHFHQSLDFL